ncbi:MAG: hypothetical protein HN778_19075 [Prolixibacteraceae bacterium]|jgi:hypothetical protein|nr:hypothetical protein [Prolixibacteraceae bacterium]MBT6004690.1 hypothetical protein [Prolixibacteraceae bacterium]MBT6765614.1 hypothetical protein [Prolixibacteraceae bacterium]MBT7000070.1 hypothetical protein [Prolixibacteraceae bacterium]MBT7396940.1 hypothetical protein [Prolixibacteraceae bacterium]
MKKIVSAFLMLILSATLFAQKSKPDLSKINDNSFWEIYNRSAKIIIGGLDSYVSFDAQQNDGLATFQNLEFENGTLEFDVKGKDVLQRSFVGIAFHIQDDKTFNAIYFRPFNFKKPERSGHSVQYISHPEFTWRKLRTDFPEQFENPVNPVPNPDDWFHAKVVVDWPNVKVFVEDYKNPSLEIKMKSEFKTGKIGFWVGNGSDGSFKNLVVTKK